jgi:uncharacterized membrane protein YphA (DoxX/SURF4 family)
MFLPVVYAGLAGVLVALIMATYRQNWSLRVFFLLALRVAIGWQFLFEGLHKIHTHEVGPTETNRPFSSEPYFKAARGPLGPYMRKQFGDPMPAITEKLTGGGGRGQMSGDALKRMSEVMQAAMCPLSVAKEIDDLSDEIIAAIKAEADAEEKAATAAEEKGLKEAKTDAEKAKVKAKAAADRAAAQKKRDNAISEDASRRQAAKSKYALWASGATRRDFKIKGIANDVPMSGPERLVHLDALRKQVQDEDDRLKAGLGNGYGIDQKKASELRIDVINAENDLYKDINAFVLDLKKETLGGKNPEAPATAPERSTGQKIDSFTMWFLVAVGGCLIAGLGTRIACLAACGFLVLTYLTHPPFPWYPLPLNTEGNPLFINKNAIEALALLTIATFPTGRWLGLDALIARLCGCGRNSELTPATSSPGV